MYRVPLGPGRTLGNAETIPLGGDFTLAAGLNLNGIDATANGKTLVAVQTNTGKLFRIDPNTGVLSWTPAGAQIGLNPVVVAAK